MDESPESECSEPWMTMRGPNQYPEMMPSMQEIVQDYMKEMSEVCHVIMKSFAKGLKLDEDYFAKHFTRH